MRRSAVYNHSGMKLRWGLYFALLAAPALPAATILDVSANATTSIASGDTLSFQVLSWNFARNALSFGQSIYPSDVSFALFTAPITGAGEFAATLQSADGAVAVDFGGPLTFTDGTLNSPGYNGAVSTLNGYLHLSPLLSEALFSASPVLILTYTGPDLSLSLNPYTLRQQLQVSLSSGPLSVGALQGPVTLQSPDPPPLLLDTLDFQGLQPPLGADQASDSAVPEPDSGLLSLGGGALLVAISCLGRFLTRRRERVAREKSTVCNP